MRKRTLSLMAIVMLLAAIAVNRIGSEPVFTSAEPVVVDASGDLATLGPIQLIDSVYAGDQMDAECFDLGHMVSVSWKLNDSSHTGSGSIAVTATISPPWILAYWDVNNSGGHLAVVSFDAFSESCPSPGTIFSTVEIPLTDGGTYFATLVTP